MKQSWLNYMSSICQPAAGGSEFQIHYRALVVRIKNEVNEAIISIPTYFYNFKQEVNTGSVKYHLNDVDAEAEKGAAISQAKIKEIFMNMEILGALQSILPNATVRFEEVNSGSLHRHPGRFGFSSIDYDKDPTNPGVIYREAEATDKVHTDSVIYLAAKDTEIFTTETRILNLKPLNGGVQGIYCQIPTVTYVHNDSQVSAEVSPAEDSLAQLLFGMIENIKTQSHSDDFNVITSMGAKDGYNLVNELLGDFKSYQYIPDMANITAERISPLYASYNRTYGYKSDTTVGTKGYYPGLWDDEEDWYGYDYGYGRASKTSNKTVQPEKKAVAAKDLENPYKIGTHAWSKWHLENRAKQ